MTATPGSHEHDDDTTQAPNPESGVGMGAGEPSTFEPEEDPGSVEPDTSA